MSGSYIYDVSVGNFHEWEFRTEMRMSAALSTLDEEGEPLQQNIAAAVSKIIEGSMVTHSIWPWISAKMHS